MRTASWTRCWTLVVIMASFWFGNAQAALKNGFVLDGALVPINEIKRGGPPRDGIAAIDRPSFVPASAAGFLRPEDRVLGYADEFGARAYPVRILNWHEIVNDVVGNHGLLITYCPLCGTGMAFTVGLVESFGVSGLLYNSDVLLYDRATESLWSQIMAGAVTGVRRGEHLELVPLRHTTWAAWRSAHPATIVLSDKTGHRIDYRVNPYAGYDRRRGLFFPVNARSRSYHPKERVVGVVIDGRARAYPFKELEGAGSSLIEQIGATTVRVHFDPVASSGWVEQLEDRSGRVLRELPSVTAFWFAWYAFHPETSVFVHGGDQGDE